MLAEKPKQNRGHPPQRRIEPLPDIIGHVLQAVVVPLPDVQPPMALETEEELDESEERKQQ